MRRRPRWPRPLRLRLLPDQVNRAESDAREQVTRQPSPEALRRIRGKSEIFVHVEGCDAPPVDIALASKGIQHLRLARCRREDHPHVALPSEVVAERRSDVRGGRPAHRIPRLKRRD